MPKKKRTKNGVVDSIEGGTYTRKEITGPCPVQLQGNALHICIYNMLGDFMREICHHVRGLCI